MGRGQISGSNTGAEAGAECPPSGSKDTGGTDEGTGTAAGGRGEGKGTAARDCGGVTGNAAVSGKK